MHERIRGVVKVCLIVGISAGSGYLGSELHSLLNKQDTPETTANNNDEMILPGYKNTNRLALDIWDRYIMTNERLNRFVVGNDIVDKDQERRIKELQEYTGIYRPTPTPKPRPTSILAR